MKTKKLLLLALSLLTLASCGKNNVTSNDVSQVTSSSEVTLNDMNGRSLKLKLGSYNRVVCIGAGALRMFSYIEETGKLCGVEDIENESLSTRPKMFDGVARPYFIANKDAYKSLPSCGVGGPQAQQAEPEKILSCNPDIVISEYEDVDKANALQTQLGVPVVTLKYGSQGVFDDKVKGSIELLGKIFNKEEKARTLNAFIDSEKASISSRVKDISESEKKSTYICGLGNWGTTNHLMTTKNYAPFNVANIKNAIVDIEGNGIQAIEKEKFESIGNNIDIMIIDAAAVKNIKPLYTETPSMFTSVKAWNEGEVYLQMAYNAYYTNIEIALANAWYNAKVVYPSKFQDIDMNAKLNQITNKKIPS